MSYEMIIGLEVTDQTSYQNYRQGMIPILHSYGGSFRYDFTIERVLKSETNQRINRLFAIEFKDQKSSDDFFADPTYKAVRSQYFEPAVKEATVIATYLR